MAIRDKEDCSAVGRPSIGDVAILIECEPARLFEASSARINLRQEDPGLTIGPPEDQSFSIGSNNESTNLSHTPL